MPNVRELLVVKPAGAVAGSVGGIAFRSLWRSIDHGHEVPESTDTTRSWRAVLPAAALQGAVFAVLHALVERALALRDRGQPEGGAVAARGLLGLDQRAARRRSHRRPVPHTRRPPPEIHLGRCDSHV
ncbi:MAG TPA: DUF4235 domain-containing protein [Actinospica sp.]|nr:DUF4235 domain-containing protein [Actinospica sp.]